MDKLEKKYQTMTITLENVSQAQSVALKKFFEYMEYLGQMGMSRNCSFYADGDGDFRPKVSFDYPEDLPEYDASECVVKWNRQLKEFENIPRNPTQGDFSIDFDEVAWKIYH